MALTPIQVRIVARACIARYDRGEGTIIEIVDSYNMQPDDREAVLEEIYRLRPDLKED